MAESYTFEWHRCPGCGSTYPLGDVCRRCHPNDPLWRATRKTYQLDLWPPTVQVEAEPVAPPPRVPHHRRPVKMFRPAT